MINLKEALGKLRTSTPSVSEALGELRSKIGETLGGSITVDQSDPNNVTTTTKPGRAKELGLAALGSFQNPVRGVATAIAATVDGGQSKEDEAAANAKSNAAEIAGQIELNKKMGYNSDALGNITTKIGEEPKVAETPPPATAETTPAFDIEKFRTGITYNESRGAQDPYTAIGPTKDLGKYQASPATLKAWSKAWLGKEYTPEEFLKDKDAQEKFFDEYTKVAERLGLSEEEAAVAWHRGWGELGIGPRETRDERFRQKLSDMMGEDISKNYIDSYMQGTGTKAESIPASDLKMPSERALPGETISQYRPTVSTMMAKGLEKLKEAVPFMDSNFEKVMKDEITKSYAWDEPAKQIIKDLDIKNKTSKVLAPFVVDYTGRADGSYTPWRGPKTYLAVRDHADLLDKFYPGARAMNTITGEHIDLDSLSASVAGHEVLHAMYQRSDINPEEFLKDFNDARSNESTDDIGADGYPLGVVYEHVEKNYPGATPAQKANELFAYVGQEVGTEGIKALPPQLRKYYEGIFK